MKPEELLRPRFEVIADYPHSEYEVGEVLDRNWSWDGDDVNGFNKSISQYPHLFKELEWWEKREEKDMPEYLKQEEFVDAYSGSLVPKIVIKVRAHFRSASGDWRNDSIEIFHAEGNRGSGTYRGWLPATREEYLAENN